MTIRKSAAKALVLLLTCALFFTSIPSAFAASHAQVDFADMVYTRPDLDELWAIGEQIDALLDDSRNGMTVVALLFESSDFLDQLIEIYTLANIHYTLDVTDAYYIAEYSYCIQAYNVAYHEYVRQIQAILNSPCAPALRRYMSNDVANFYLNSSSYDEAQFALLAKETELEMAYQAAAMQPVTLEYKGQTVSSYSQGLQLADNWEEAQEFDLLYDQTYNARLGSLFLELVQVRTEFAQSLGYDNYIEYAYEAVYTRNYSPAETKRLFTDIAQHMLPLYDQLYAAENSALTEAYDNYVSGLGQEQIANLIGPYFMYIDGSLSEAYSYMRSYNLYDFRISATKESGAYVATIPGYNAPFMFINPTRSWNDVNTFIHEFGHYNNSYQNDGGGSNMDLMEIYSQGLETLFIELAEEIFQSEDHGYAMGYYTLSSILSTVVDAALIGRFEVLAYENPGFTLDELNAAMAELIATYDSFYYFTNEYYWAYYPHIYQSPGYYISYCTSALPALELWALSNEDRDAAITAYLGLVDYGYSDSLLYALEQSGLGYPFAGGYIADMSARLEQALKDSDYLYYFSDIADHWALESILVSYYHNLISGTGERLFEPQKSLSGAELITILSRLYQLETGEDPLANYTTAADSPWYTAANAWASAASLTQDIENFSPTEPLSREGFCVLLANYAALRGLELTAVTLSFNDQDQISSWARTAVAQLVGAGVISGKDGNLLDPQGGLTRAEATTMLVRYLELL